MKDARIGDTVTFRTAQGQLRKGRVVLIPRSGEGEHVVVNCGGRHGTPKCVDANNFVSLRKAKNG